MPPRRLTLESRTDQPAAYTQPSDDVLLVTVGACAELGVQAAARAAEQGIGVTVVDPGWVLPVPEALIELGRSHRLVVTVEDGLRVGGVGTAIGQLLSDAHVHTPIHVLGIPKEFIPHGSRAEILTDIGLTPQDVARSITEWALQSGEEQPAASSQQRQATELDA